MSSINWQQQNDTLYLCGTLVKHNLAQIWRQRAALFGPVNSVDISALSTLDSAGLALLVNCCLSSSVKLVGINPQTAILIKLYNLEEVMNENDK